MLFEETGNTVTLCLSGSPTAFGATFSNSSRDEGGVWLLGFCDLTRMTQATNNTPATANDRGKYLWVRITGFRRSKSSRRTVELTRPRGSANSDLQKLHAKHAFAARVQRFVRRFSHVVAAQPESSSGLRRVATAPAALPRPW